MKLRAEIKLQAKKNFTSQYGISVAAVLLLAAIAFVLSLPGIISNWNSTVLDIHEYGINFSYYPVVHPGIAGPLGLASLLLMPPIYVGYAFFCLKIYRGEQGDIGQMFGAGFRNYGRSLGGMLWMYLFTFLWTLLFIIPGIVKAIAYFATPYILADSKNVSATDALKLSMRMTNGYKGEIFVMGLSFIGWAILTALTGGILGILYTGPYFGTSFAGMYEELKKNALEKGIVTAEELA